MASRRKMRRNPWGDEDPRLPDSKANRPHLPKARKDRKRWCGGHVGREHTPELVINHQFEGAPFHGGCKWYIMGRTTGSAFTHYSCRHAMRCSTCGKYVKYQLQWDECPDRELHPEPMTTNWTPRVSLKVARK